MADEARIKTQPNGPYLVNGGVRLHETSPVHTYNGEPVAWHDLGEVTTERETYALCRCGKSDRKPFCDGTHAKLGFDGTETAPRGDSQERRTRLPGDGIVMTDEEALCHSAGFCGTRTTNVWQLIEETSDPAAKERLKAMVALCPSGRLQYSERADEAAEEPTLPAAIGVVPGGPLYVQGGIAVEAADGVEWEAMNRRTLCRCGESKNKPFCDGAHSELHFDER